MNQMENDLQELRRMTSWKLSVAVITLFIYNGAVLLVIMALQLLRPRLLASLVTPLFLVETMLVLLGIGCALVVTPRTSRFTGVRAGAPDPVRSVYLLRSGVRDILASLRFAWLRGLFRG